MSNWFSIIFFTIGVIIFVLIIRYIVITSRCSRWPVVVGDMISSEMKPRYKKLAQFAEATHTLVSINKPEIIYIYEIKGEKFTLFKQKAMSFRAWMNAFENH